MYQERDVVVVVHLGYNRTSLDSGLLEEEVKMINGLEFPKIEIVEGDKAYFNSDRVNCFPHEDELKGYNFGKVYVCGAMRDRCIPRLEASLSGFCDCVIRLNNLIH